MGLISPTLPTPGDPRGTEEADVGAALQTILNAINGGLDAANLTAAFQNQLNVSANARGKSIIAAAESRTNVAYGLLGTPDVASGIVLPTDGLIAVAYSAMWQESVANAARAAIFIGSNQIRVPFGDGAVGSSLSLQAARTGEGTAAAYRALATGPIGLASMDQSQVTADPVTTGQVIGVAPRPIAQPAHYEIETQGGTLDISSDAPLAGPVYLFAAAGTYDVSVQFKATSGSVTAKNRKLWVWVEAF